jgi:hypothetical protein
LLKHTVFIKKHLDDPDTPFEEIAVSDLLDHAKHVAELGKESVSTVMNDKHIY